MTERHPETGTDQTPTPDAIRERHQPVDVPYATGRQVCTLCLQRWPCDTRVVLDDLPRGVARYMAEAEGWKRERDAARADADRLAEAGERLSNVLRRFNLPDHDEYADSVRDIIEARDALRQHDGSDSADETDRTRQTPPETERLAVGLAGDQLDLAKSGLSPEMPGPGWDAQTRRHHPAEPANVPRDPDRGVYGEPDE
jgi:hypothetical protein